MLGIELVAVAAVYATFSLLLQRKLVNVDKMYEIRAKMNEGTKKLSELIKSNAAKEEIAKKQKEIMEISTQQMTAQFKPMIVIFPIFLLLYYVILPLHFNLSANTSLLSFTLSYHLLFIIALFVIGILLSIIFSVYDRKRLKDKYNFGLMQPSFKGEQAPQNVSDAVKV